MIIARAGQRGQHDVHVQRQRMRQPCELVRAAVGRQLIDGVEEQSDRPRRVGAVQEVTEPADQLPDVGGDSSIDVAEPSRKLGHEPLQQPLHPRGRRGRAQQPDHNDARSRPGRGSRHKRRLACARLPHDGEHAGCLPIQVPRDLGQLLVAIDELVARPGCEDPDRYAMARPPTIQCRLCVDHRLDHRGEPRTNVLSEGRQPLFPGLGTLLRTVVGQEPIDRQPAPELPFKHPHVPLLLVVGSWAVLVPAEHSEGPDRIGDIEHPGRYL